MKTKLIGGITVLFFITGCASESAPLSTSIASPSCWWVQSNTLEEVWPYLEQEKVQKFGLASKNSVVEPPHYEFEITEPKKIKIIMALLRKAMEETEEREEKGEYGWSGTVIPSGWEQMIIITDKHKYAIFVEDDGRDIYGMEWVSPGLRKQLWEWGFVEKGRVYKYLVPPKEQTVAILLYSKHCLPYYPVAIFGDKELAKERMFGIKVREGEIRLSEDAKKFEPKKIFEGYEWLEKIMDAYEAAFKEAEEKEKYYPDKPEPLDVKIIFITRDRSYWKGIGISESAVYDDYIKSEQLKAYFEELGLTKELLAGEPNAVRHPQADKAPQN